MSAVQGPGSTRRGRVAGLALIAVALIALVIGVITLFTGGGSDNAGPTSNPPSPPPGSATSKPGGTSTSRPATSTTSSPTSSSTTTTTAPPATAQPPQPPPNNRSVPIRVFNNGTISGLAAQAARDFRGDGWNVVEVGNYSQGIIRTSTAYFRPGTGEEPAARELAAKFNMRAEARFPGIAGASPGVIVMVTNDYGGK